MKILRSCLAILGLFCALSASAESLESAFRASLLKSFDDATGKTLQLAEAIPEADYGWQPMDGVNTVREILVHVTEANLSLAGMLGGTAPDGLTRKTADGKMQTKAEAIAVTKQVVAYVRGVLATVPAEELAIEINFFGGKAPKIRVAMVTTDHAHEHLGQLIAYARANHVVPPWSK